jgi:hypothetical protein
VTARSRSLQGGDWGQTNCRHNLEMVDTRLYWGFSIEALSPIGFLSLLAP